MARKSVNITIKDRGNDLEFKITEMPATQLEAWITRILMLTGGLEGQAGNQLDNAALFAAGDSLFKNDLGALTGLEYGKIKPLLDEMLGCCARVVEGVEVRCTPQNIDDYVQDVSTLFRLRMEVLKLNLGFYLGEAANAFASPEKAFTAAR